MLRVYVFHVLRLFFGIKVLKEARKYRHLEQGQGCSCNFNRHMDGRHCAPHSWYVPPTDYEKCFVSVVIWPILQVSYGWILISTVLDKLGLSDNRRSALRGRPWQRPALCSTWKALYLLSLLYSLPTLCYSSPCSLACSACVSKEPVS
jgi:hypothetical protein